MNDHADTKETPMGDPRIQVLSCRCICRRYDGKTIVVNADCLKHRVHPDFADPSKVDRYLRKGLHGSAALASGSEGDTA